MNVIAKLVSKQEQETIKRMRLEGYGSRVIAIELGRSDKTIQNWFVRLGLPSNLKEAGMAAKTNHVGIIICKNCNEEYATKRLNTLFCSETCRGSYNRNRRGTKQVCGYCGTEYTSYNITEHCSSECRSKRLRAKQLMSRRIVMKKNECEECGLKSLNKYKRKYCSEVCRYRSTRVSLARTHNIKCIECGKHKEVSRTRKRYCSKECGKRYMNRKSETDRRKAISTNGKVDWDISIERLLKRDGHKCYICDKAVIMNGDTNHEFYPSIEHVKAIANGGTHTWDNVKLAHRKCNWEKGINEIEFTL